MKIIFVIFIMLLNLNAHPHFFIDAFIDIQKDRIVNKWVFDRINSKLLIFDFDKNKNKQFEKSEQLSFLETHFEKLKNDNYNLFLEIDGNELVSDPTNMEVKIVNKRVELSFELILKIKQGGVICTIDPTLYYAYKLKEVKSIYKNEIQKSKHDYCLGVTK